MTRPRFFLIVYPFTMLGLISYVLFLGGGFLLERYGEAGGIPDLLVGVWRVLIAPAYTATLAVALLGAMFFGSVETTPLWYPWISLPLHLVPFIVLDLLVFSHRTPRWQDQRGEPEQGHR
ncbi:hypothetical protein BH23GEM7_BH23GEM7_10760 [soil metagenome]|jgi:hypothetical protein